MESALENLSKQELITLLKQEQKANKQLLDKQAFFKQELAYKQYQIEDLKRQLFGQKRERFEQNPHQLDLPFTSTAQETKAQQEETLQKINYTRRKRSKQHPGRFPLPKHLPVKEIKIYPDVSKAALADMVCIGQEVTEELDYTPAQFHINRYIRYKYAAKTKDKVTIGELPSRVIDKGIPSAAVIAIILVDKYMYHLPLYRQQQRFTHAGMPISSTTMDGWVRQGLLKLEILYEHLVKTTKRKGYLQVDETPIKVLDKNKKGKCHLGYYWVYHCPLDGTVLFDYQRTRGGKEAVESLLADFTGYIQTDGYPVYERFAQKPLVVHVACWAHARREFEKALSNNKERATQAMQFIQQLYQVERLAKEQQLSPAERKELRLEKALPIIKQFGKWLYEQISHDNLLPKSPISKAIQYTLKRWEQLQAYLYDGSLEIDNNLVENSIRPVALGRKNYLFAGSHKAAQRAAMIYSFFAMCKKYEVNPFEWLKYVLENIMDMNHKHIEELYPQNFKRK